LSDLLKRDPEQAKQLIRQLPFQERLRLFCRIPAKDKLVMLELVEDRIKLVRSLPKQELFFAVQELGKESALELISRASYDQINFLLDLDCWRKDQIDVDRLKEWIKVLWECSPRKLLSWMQKVDLELLIFFFRTQIVVVKPDDPSNPDDPAFRGLPRELYFTLDNQYFIEFIGAADMQDLVYQILKQLFPLDYSLYFTIMEGVIWELNMSLEEEARHWRQARLEEAGFPPLDEALEIYQYMNPDSFNPQSYKKLYPVQEYESLSEVDPSLGALIPFRSYLPARSQQSFLIRSLRHLQEEEACFLPLQQELVVLLNKVMLVEITDFSQEKEIRRAFEIGHDYLNIGLEYLSRGNMEQARRWLKEIRLQSIFQLGYNLVRRLQKQARQLRSELRSIPLPLSPEGRWRRREVARLLVGLLRRHPELYIGKMEGVDKAHYRPLTSLEDLRRAEQRLAEAKELCRPQ